MSTGRRAASAARIVWVATAAAVAWGCGGGSATPRIVYVTQSPGPTGSASASPSESASPGVTATPSATPVPVAATLTQVKVTLSGTTGTCVDWKVAIKKPVVGGLPEGAATAMNMAIDAKVSAAIDSFETVMGNGGGGSGPCTLAGDFSVAFSSTSLLSLRLVFVQYTGGASSSTIAAGANFRTDGAGISLAELFTDPAAGAARLSTESRTRLLAQLGPQGVDADWIGPGTLPAMASFEGAWAFTQAGLELTFQEVTVAPHALGTPRIVIPWASLAGVVDPAGPAAAFIP